MNLLPTIYPVACHTDNVGPGTIFVAIKGQKDDGLLHIPRALVLGSRHIVIEEGVDIELLKLLIEQYEPIITRVKSARQALAQLSAQAYNYPAQSFKIIGITGTKGKTTTTFLIEHFLKAAGYKTALISSVENRILDVKYPAPLTTPQPDYLHTFLAAAREAGVQYVIMEVAAQALSLHRVETISFDAALFTNFSLEHSEFYASQQDYFEAKLRLFEQCSGLAIINKDDMQLHAATGQLENKKLISLRGSADIQGFVKKSDLTGLSLDISQSGNSTNFKSSLLGAFSAYNIVMAYAVVRRYDIDHATIQQALDTFAGVPGRLQRIDLPNGAVSFIDIAHTPSSFEALLSSIRPLTSHLIVVFGAGGDRDRLKRPLMGALAQKYADLVYITTDNPRSEDPAAIVSQIATGITDSSKIIIEADREKAIKAAYVHSRPGSIIALLGKGHAEYQHIKDRKIPFSERTILLSI